MKKVFPLKLVTWRTSVKKVPDVKQRSAEESSPVTGDSRLKVVRFRSMRRKRMYNLMLKSIYINVRNIDTAPSLSFIHLFSIPV